MKKIFLTLALITGMIASAQVRIGGTGTAVDANAILELQSSTKGLLFPNVALTGTTAFAPLAAHVAGMTVYNTATAGDVTPGLYANNGTAWVKLGGSSSAAALNVTAEQTGSYTALATDDIILYNASSTVTLTLPTTGVAVGKKYYISNKGQSGLNLSPLPREEQNQGIAAISGAILMYLGGTGNGSWSFISGY
jgi:hypothetical protein